jgi:hypothetical protein
MGKFEHAAQFWHSSRHANTKQVLCLGRVMKLSSVAFRGPYQPLKELLNVSDAGIKVSDVASKISHPTGKVI